MGCLGFLESVPLGGSGTDGGALFAIGFTCPKVKDLTIAGRLLGVEVIAGLKGLHFDVMEEGKGRGFDGTFRLSTLIVVVIFLPAAFPMLVDFHFVLVCLCVGVITTYHM